MKRILVILVIAGAALITSKEAKAQHYYTTMTYSYGEWYLPTYESTVIEHNYYHGRIVNARSYYVNGYLNYNLFLNVGNTYVELVIDHHGHIVNRHYFHHFPVNHVWIHTYNSPFFRSYHHHGHHTVYYYNNYHNHNHHVKYQHHKKHHKHVSYSDNHYVVKKDQSKNTETRERRYTPYQNRPESHNGRIKVESNSRKSNVRERPQSNNRSHYGQAQNNSKNNTPQYRGSGSGSNNNRSIKSNDSNSRNSDRSTKSGRQSNSRSSVRYAQNRGGSR